MFDHDALGKFFSWATAAWGALLLNAVALFRAWPAIMGRRNEARRDAAAEKASDWERLRSEVNRLSERVEALETKVEECERREDAWRERAVTAESELVKLQAYELGRGVARQEAQKIVSAEREQQKPTGPSGGGK